MGLFDKIRDNARDLSIKALDATREYDEDYQAEQRKKASPATEPASNDTKPAEEPQTVIEPTSEQPDTELSFEEPVVEAAVATEEKSEPEEPKTEDKPAEKPARRSKVTEISKTEYEQSQKEKQRQEEQEKTKQAAKERLAKSYTPSYKAPGKNKSADKAESETEDKKEAAGKKPAAAKPRTIPVGIIDVTPGKFTDPTKQAIYARERAALSALASQRKLNGTVPLYVATHMSFKTRVFINRIEYSGSFGKNVLPIDQVSWIKLRAGGTGVIIETTEGKRVVMVVKPADRLAFADAVLKVQAMQPKRSKFKDTQTVRIDQLEQFSNGVDEIEKLAKLYDKGILSQEEFDAKKRQILGL